MSTTMALDRGIFAAIAAFRWLALSWAIVGAIIARGQLERPLLAWAALGVAAATTATATAFVAFDHPQLDRARFLVAELVVAAGLLVLDGVTYLPGREQSLPWAWPAAVIISFAVSRGPLLGLVVALACASASFVGESLLEPGGWSLSDASKTALYVLAALGAGYTSKRLRQAEAEISTARAREQIARTLHDGVLQTLAVIQRRSNDAELGRLARDQERELRAFLFGADPGRRPLEVALRESADVVSRRHGVAIETALATDLPVLDDRSVEALVGAVREALTNAAKHSGATRITMYAEPAGANDRAVLCSVLDDGIGFDPSTIDSGQGLRGSIRDRIEEVGGTVTVRSQPDRGTEVELWVD